MNKSCSTCERNRVDRFDKIGKCDLESKSEKRLLSPVQRPCDSEYLYWIPRHGIFTRLSHWIFGTKP